MKLDQIENITNPETLTALQNAITEIQLKYGIGTKQTNFELDEF